MWGKKPLSDEPATDLLFVCTGNICRSTYGALWMRHAAGDRLTVASAGTGAVVGAPAHEEIASMMSARGVPTDHVARQLTRPILQSTSLVIGMTREHRSAAVSMFPGVLKRSVTLLEVAQLAPHVDTSALPTDPRERVRALGPAIMAARGKVVSGEGFDIADPYGRDHQAFVDMGAVMDEALPALYDLIFPA